MALRWKNSVRFDDLHAAMVFAAMRIDAIYANFGVDQCWITSANDSAHAAKSKHYDGRALDFRTKNVSGNVVGTLTNAIREALGPQYTVILEDLSRPNEHIHVQYNGSAYWLNTERKPNENQRA